MEWLTTRWLAISKSSQWQRTVKWRRRSFRKSFHLWVYSCFVKLDSSITTIAPKKLHQHTTTGSLEQSLIHSFIIWRLMSVSSFGASTNCPAIVNPCVGQVVFWNGHLRLAFRVHFCSIIIVLLLLLLCLLFNHKRHCSWNNCPPRRRMVRLFITDSRQQLIPGWEQMSSSRTNPRKVTSIPSSIVRERI